MIVDALRQLTGKRWGGRTIGVLFATSGDRLADTGLIQTLLGGA